MTSLPKWLGQVNKWPNCHYRYKKSSIFVIVDFTMRAPFGTILLLTMLLGGTYWYTQVSAVCPVPLAYSIGRIDDGFNLTFNEARIAVMDAEAVWENTTGRNLFSYQDDADFTINFIYDDRQERADEEGELKLILDVKENLNEKLEETYSELVSRYNQQELKYKDGREAYERRLNVYNEEVDKYNQEGGAPAGVYDELEERRLSLKAEESQLNAEVKKLNEYVDQINSLGQEGSELINQYNQNVEQYNETFAQEREFTQGDYQYKSINIYTFKEFILKYIFNNSNNIFIILVRFIIF